MVDRGFLPTRSGEEKLRGQYRGCNPSFLPHKGNHVGGQALGAYFPSVSALGRTWKSWSAGQTDHLLPQCPTQPQVSPADFREA